MTWTASAQSLAIRAAADSHLGKNMMQEEEYERLRNVEELGKDDSTIFLKISLQQTLL